MQGLHRFALGLPLLHHAVEAASFGSLAHGVKMPLNRLRVVGVGHALPRLTAIASRTGPGSLRCT